MKYKICTFCVMDTTDPDIVFDKNGVCNHCYQAQKSLKENELEKHNLPKIIETIKKHKGRYNCLVGLSGGVDSSMVLHHAVKLGLRPLCYTVDNGHNTPLSDENIMQMVEKLRIPFYRYTINYQEFHKLQQAFIDAKVANLEIPTDHILLATIYEMAVKNNIKWILSGGNTSTESIMPRAWGYQARDLVHIKDIYRRHRSEKKLKHIPTCGLFRWNYYKWIKGIKTLYLLDYLEYNRDKSKKLLRRFYNWQDYGEKHCESSFTKWFQEKYLIKKFGFDKRKAHYSSLINSGQMTRVYALRKLRDSPKRYKRLDNYKDYKTDEWLFNSISLIIRFLRKWRY